MSVGVIHEMLEDTEDSACNKVQLRCQGRIAPPVQSDGLFVNYGMYSVGGRCLHVLGSGLANYILWL